MLLCYMIIRVQVPTLYIHNNKNFGNVNWEKIKAHDKRCLETFFYLNN